MGDPVPFRFRRNVKFLCKPGNGAFGKNDFSVCDTFDQFLRFINGDIAVIFQEKSQCFHIFTIISIIDHTGREGSVASGTGKTVPVFPSGILCNVSGNRDVDQLFCDDFSGKIVIGMIKDAVRDRNGLKSCRHQMSCLLCPGCPGCALGVLVVGFLLFLIFL